MVAQLATIVLCLRDWLHALLATAKEHCCPNERLVLVVRNSALLDDGWC